MKKSVLGILVLIAGCAYNVTLPTAPVDLSPKIKAVADGSACAQISWPGRGKAPMAYYEFLAESYHQAYCSGVAVDKLGSPDKDALAWYGLEANLINTYTLITGLGMRESSGEACTGRDGSASNVSAASAEAGPFQFSYDSIGADPRLSKIYGKWKGCATVTCNSKNWGTGEGVEFQKLAKVCPAFSTEYTAQLIRVLRRHFGPLNRKEAQVRSECAAMYTQIAGLGCADLKK